MALSQVYLACAAGAILSILTPLLSKAGRQHLATSKPATTGSQQAREASGEAPHSGIAQEELALQCGVAFLWEKKIYGKGVTVGLLDSGIDQRALGRVGAQVVRQIDLTADHDPGDALGHGTEMSKRILGYAPESQIVSLKVIDKAGKVERDTVIRALEYCARQHPAVRVVNVSLGFDPGGCTEAKPCALCSTVNKVASLGIIVVASAGNEGRPYPNCPARAAKALSVGAAESRPLFSRLWFRESLGQPVSGTSVAAASVAGGIALLLSAIPDLKPDELTQAIDLSAKPVTDRKGEPVVLGGRAHFYRAYKLLHHGRAGRMLDADVATRRGNTGIRLRELEKYEESVSQFTSAIELYPHSYGLYNELGMTYLAAKDYNQALTIFKESIRLNWEASQPHLNLGIALWGLKRFDEAVSEFKIVHQQDPELYKKHVLPRAERLDRYVISYDTLDFPGEFVAREWFSVAGRLLPGAIAARAQTLEEVRARLPVGLLRLERDPLDDDKIVESWLVLPHR